MSPEEVLRLSLTGSFFPSELSPPMHQLLKEILNMRNQNGEPVKLGTSGWLQARLGRHLLSAQVPGWGSWHKHDCSREALPCLVLAFWCVSKHFLLGSSDVWVCKVKTQKTEFQIKETGISLSSSPPSSPATRPSNSEADFWRRSSFDLGWHFTT